MKSSLRIAAISLSILVASHSSFAQNQQPKKAPAPTTGLRDGFLSPPAPARLRCYWWWLNGNTTADAITRDLEGMKSHGYGGAILVDADGSGKMGNVEVRPGPAMGSPQWLALFVHALSVAKQLNLELSLNVTSSSNVGIIGGATVTPEDAIKQLTWSRTIVDGGSARTLQLAPPPAQNGFYRPVAVMAYRLRHGAALPGAPGSDRSPILDLATKTASEETGLSLPPNDRVLRNGPSHDGEEDAEVSDVVDLTSHVDQNGNLEWTFPSGTWEVLRVGYTDTPKHITDYAGKPVGLPLDVLDPKAFDDYWHDYVSPMLDAAKPYIGTSLRYVVTDSWEAGGTNWTPAFREEFKRRRGYDPLPYLPIVSGRILSSREVSNRFLFDLRRTVADLIAQNYYDRFEDHARKLGLGTHPEAGGPHGAPIDSLENFRNTDFPQGEFWVVSAHHRVTDDQRFFVKVAASAAHIYGKPFVAAEGPTSMNPLAWSESLSDDVQPAFDHALTEGLNRLFWHEFTSSPTQYGLPGQEFFAGTHLNRTVTWWGQAAPFIRALNRAQFLMQQGLPVSDLLYFYGDQVPGLVRLRSDDPAHVLPGYDYDVVNEDALFHRMQFSGSGLRTPEGVQYRALALPSSHRISYPALQWVQRYVEQGGTVIGLEPTAPLGIIPDDQQADYKRIADTVWAGCNGAAASARFGKGTIYCSDSARSQLLAMGIAPDFSYQLNGADQPKDTTPAFEYIHRRTSTADIYFVRNTQPQTLEATLSFRVQGRTPELWSADSGVTTPAAAYSETPDGRTEIPLTFPARGSVFLVFEHPAQRHLTRIEQDGKQVFPSIHPGTGAFSGADQAFVATSPGTYTTTDSDGNSKTLTVDAAQLKSPVPMSWTLSFPAGWGAPASVPLPRFQSWTEFTDPNIRFFSGTATYHTTLQIPATLIAPDRQLWLHLGQLREIATVRVNNRQLDTLWQQPFTVRVDPFLHAGANTIEIDVTNFWPNRLIGDLQPTATQHFTHTNVRSYTKDSPLRPSGILQPVELQTAKVLSWK